MTDTGPGIPPRQLERLFNAFEQLEASTARTHGGTGLGLNISRQLAKLMGGDLTVKSLAGDGTTFSLRLPHTRLEGAVEREDCEQPVAPSMDLRVLIVDDHEINRKAFSLMLRPFCGRIVTAKDGQAALELLSINEFDVVLMDMNMPVMGGVEAVKRLRGSNGMNRNTPVVALTASSAVDHVDHVDHEALVHQQLQHDAEQHELHHQADDDDHQHQAGGRRRRGRAGHDQWRRRQGRGGLRFALGRQVGRAHRGR